MGANILLIGRSGEETNTLKRELKRQEVYSVDVATTPNQAIDNLTSNRVDLLVFNTEILTKKKLSMASDLRDIGTQFPVLLLANSIMADAVEDLNKSKGTVFLEKPFEVKDFFGITDKLISGQEVRQRIFRRFQTYQEGSFSKHPALDMITAVRIRNLSQGGAYFEYEGRSHAQIGDQIYLGIPLQQVQKEYKMKAKVVWTTQPAAIGRHGLGVEFIR